MGPVRTLSSLRCCRLWQLSWAVLCLSLCPPLAAQGEPRVEDLLVELDGTEVLVSFRLQGALDETLEQRLESGLPTGFVYRLQLMRDRLRWADRRLESATLQIDAMYNALAREYLVNLKLDGQLIESRVVREKEELLRALTEVQRLRVFDVGELRGERRCLVRARAVLGTRTVFFLVPSTRVTPWLESAKFHLPEPLRSS